MRDVFCVVEALEYGIACVSGGGKSWECGMRIVGCGLRHGYLPCGLRSAVGNPAHVGCCVGRWNKILGMWNEELCPYAVATAQWDRAHGMWIGLAVGNLDLCSSFI